ncbi:MAG: ParB/RepB/Spo0J family partition protein [Fibrobacteria bacterium]|nr:ParB/RepB/Spo0J family partition protein [Fibrobacteria bacterium]
MSQRRALGKGLDAIFANLGSEVQNPKTGASVHEIELAKISPNPFQPRLEFSDAELQELADSIAVNGLIQPIFLRKHAGAYQIVSGERRFRAFQRLKLDRIPALVRDQVSDRDMRELALVENIQRVQLNALEEAQAYDQLANEVGLTHEEIAGRVGKSRAAVTNTLRLLKLEPEVREWLRAGKLTAGHGRALLQFTGATQVKQARAILGAGLNVRQAEGARRPAAAKAPDANTRAFLEEFQSLAGMKVTLKGDTQNGRARGVLEIHYENRDALNGLIEILRRGRAG